MAAPPIDIEYMLRRNWWASVDVREPDECWPWKQSTGSHGYGQTWDKQTVRVAHRVAWTLHHGEQIPDGMTIDHICRVRVCCNPDHLRLLTNAENGRLNGNAVKTHCIRGHEFTEANTYRTRQGHRTCRACIQERRLAA